MYVPCVGVQYVREVSLKQTGEMNCQFEGAKNCKGLNANQKRFIFYNLYE
jgi:hypothetical protein